MQALWLLLYCVHTYLSKHPDVFGFWVLARHKQLDDNRRVTGIGG